MVHVRLSMHVAVLHQLLFGHCFTCAQLCCAAMCAGRRCTSLRCVPCKAVSATISAQMVQSVKRQPSLVTPPTHPPTHPLLYPPPPQGRVVGMVVSPHQAGGRAAGYGLGYALPVEALRGLVGQMLVYGRPSRPTLGISLAPPQAR